MSRASARAPCPAPRRDGLLSVQQRRDCRPRSLGRTQFGPRAYRRLGRPSRQRHAGNLLGGRSRRLSLHPSLALLSGNGQFRRNRFGPRAFGVGQAKPRAEPIRPSRGPTSGFDSGHLAGSADCAPSGTGSTPSASGGAETSGQRRSVQIAALVRMAVSAHPNGTESDQLVGRRYLARPGRSALRAGSNAGEMKDSRAVLERVQPRGNCDLAGERPSNNRLERESREPQARTVVVA